MKITEAIRKASAHRTHGIYNRTGYFSTQLATLEAKARKVRANKPECFSVRKLAKELKCSNHNSSVVYYRILRGEDDRHRLG